MGKHNENVRINLGFTADTSKAKAQLQDLQNSLNRIINMPNSKFGDALTEDISKAKHAAASLAIELEKATNVDTGNLDFSKLEQSLKKSNISLTAYANDLRKLGPEGEYAFMQLAKSVINAEIPLKRTNKLVNDLWTSLKNTMRWQISASVLNGLQGAMQKAVGYAEDLNESLNNIRIVTGRDTAQMVQFAEAANKAARSLSTTTTAYTDASLIYYQQGLSEEEVAKRTEVTIKMANAAGASAQEVSDQLTAVWNNFYDGSKSLEYYADVMTALGAATASSTDEISEGLNKFAAVAETVGLSYEYATSALATVTATTRESADVVGTAFKTLFARIQGLKLGETLDDGTDVNKYSQALASVGIKIKDTNGELKDMNSILDELGAKWKTLSKDTQTALAQTVAGTRQYNQLIALMDNWDYFQMNLGVATGASGTLNEQAEIYAESWEAARDRVETALQSIYSTLLDEDIFIGVLGFIENMIVGIDTLVNGMGGLGGVVSTLGAILTKVFSQQLAQGINNSIYNIYAGTRLGKQMIQDQKTKQVQELADTMAQGDSRAAAIYKKRLELQKQFVENERNLSNDDKKRINFMGDALEKAGDRAVVASRAKTWSRQELNDTGTRFSSEAIVHAEQIEKLQNEKIENLKHQKLENELKQTKIEEKIATAKKLHLTQIGSDGQQHSLAEKYNQELKAIQKVNNQIQQEIDKFNNIVKGGVAKDVQQSLGGSVRLGENLKFFEQELSATEDGTLEIDNLEKANRIANEIATSFSAINESVANLNNKGLDIVSEDELKELQELTYEINNSFQKLNNGSFAEVDANELSLKVLRAKELQDKMSTNLEKRAVSDIGIKSETVEKYTQSIKENIQAVKEDAQATEDLTQIQQGYENAINRQTVITADFGQTLSSFSNAVMSLGSAYHSLRGAMDTLNDPDLSGMEKFMSIMTSATQGTLMMIQTITSFKAAIEALDLVHFKENVTIGLNTAATILNEKAERKLADAKMDSAKASTIKAEALDKESKESLENAIVASQGLDQAVKNFGSALTSYLPVIGSVAAVVAIVATTIGAAVYQYNKQSEAAQNATMQAEEAQKAYEEALNSYNSLATAVSSYENATKSLSDMTKGTLEWKEAIVNANDEALKLLETYDGLKYSTSEGLIVIDKQSLEDAQEAALTLRQTSQGRAIAAKEAAQQMQLEQQQTDIARKLKTEDQSYRVANTNVAATAGLTTGMMVGSIFGPLGTAIGGAVGGLTGLIAGAVTGTSEKSENEALDSLAAAYERDSAKVEAAFAGNEQALEQFLTEELQIDDKALIDSLIANKKSTLDLIKSQNALKDSIQAQRQPYIDLINADNAEYANSKAKEYAAYNKAQNMAEPTEEDIEAVKQEMFAGWGDDYSAYTDYLSKTQGGTYRVVDTAGLNATLQKLNDEGTWEQVGEANTLTQEAVAYEVAKYQAAQISSDDLKNAESIQKAWEQNLKDMGLDSNLIESVALQAYQGAEIDLSSITKEQRDALLANLNQLDDPKLRNAMHKSLLSWTQSFEDISQKQTILNHREVANMSLGDTIDASKYDTLGPELQSLFAENLDGTYTLIDHVKSIDGKIEDKTTQNYLKQLEDLDKLIAQEEKSKNNIIPTIQKALDASKALGSDGKPLATKEIEANKERMRQILRDYGGYTDADFFTYYSNGERGDVMTTQELEMALENLLKENYGADGKQTIHDQNIAKYQQDRIDLIEEWKTAAETEDEVNMLRAYLSRDEQKAYMSKAHIGEAKALGVNIDEWENLTGVLQRSSKWLQYNKEGAQQLATTYYELTLGLSDLNEAFSSSMEVLKDESATVIQTNQALSQMQNALDKMFEGDLDETKYGKEFFKANEDLISKVLQGDAEAYYKLKNQLLAEEGFAQDAGGKEYQAILNAFNDNSTIKEAGATTTSTFQNAVNDWIATGQTKQEVETLLRLIGYDGSVTQSAGGKITVNWNTVRYQDDATVIQTALASIGEEAKGTQVELTKLTDELVRYKEIDDILDDVSRSYSKATEAANKLYGTSKVESLIKANQKLKDSIGDIDAKYAEAEDYLQTDKNALASSVKDIPNSNVKLELDANGNIANYDEIMKAAVAYLNKEEKTYNNLTKDQQSEDTRYEKAKEFYEQLKENLSQYDETRELLEDLTDEKANKLSEWQSNNLEILALQYETISKKITQASERINYSIEDMSNDWTKIAETSALVAGKLDPLQQTLAATENYMQTLGEKLASGEIDLAQYNQEIEKSQDTMMNTLTEIKALKEEMSGYYDQAFSKITDEITKYTDKVEHLNSITEHYQNMLGILGKEKNYDYMSNILDAQASIAENQLTIAKQEYESAKENAEMLRIQYEKNPLDEVIKANWEAADKVADEKQSEMLAKTENWAEAYSAILENTLGKAAQALENAFTGGTSFDQMNSRLERANSLQEEYLTTTNQIYETTKMMRTAQNAIDDTTNTVAKAKLRSFIQETEQLQKQTKLSQYELDIQQAKYDLILAEIALEEAQNAKSTVRLRRDAEGNFGYVYTADSNAIAEAQQKYDDAQNSLYNKGLEGANSYVEKYQQTMSSLYDTLTDINQKYRDGEFESEQEYQTALEEAKAYHYAQLENYSSLYAVAIETDSRVIKDAWSSSFSDMVYSTNIWKDNIDTYLTTVQGAFKDFFEKTDGTLASDSVLNSLAKDVQTITDKLTGDGGLLDVMKNEMLEVVNTIVTRFLELSQAIEEKILPGLEKSLGLTGDLRVGDEVKYKGETYQVTSVRDGQATISNGQANGTLQGIPITELERFASGGYTGAWSEPGGRIGILDQKEIILNAHDTENFLASLDLMRDIIRVIDLQAANAQFDSILSSGGFGTLASGPLEQNVKIEATFPNVTDHNEIEEAFNNLINTASQYAHR